MDEPRVLEEQRTEVARGGRRDDRSQVLVPLETRPGPWWEVLLGHGLAVGPRAHGQACWLVGRRTQGGPASRQMQVVSKPSGFSWLLTTQRITEFNFHLPHDVTAEETRAQRGPD